MQFRLICLTAIGLVCGISSTALAYEAPVVDVTQQPQDVSNNGNSGDQSAQSAQLTGGSWQPVASNNNNNNANP